ncbi:unnamed protein product [Linum tenue]|uniref:C3H1-type domain-containing protein n=1 Tax=Linum tenue TaxID=586396 RepID=A0AAV0I5S3_9ROSI|nr:unnamed protein product [Linum tenue]
MKRWRKSNRVTWAPDVRLSQVKLFSRDDCPSKVGNQAQCHVKHRDRIPRGILQNPNSREFSDLPPPGFEDSHSQFATLLQWKCPPKFGLSSRWCVAAGEESQEMRAQKQREMSLFEAVYPRLSAVPPNPCNLLNAECEKADACVPIIPLTPVEEDAEALVPPSPMKCQPPPSAHESANQISKFSPPSDLVEKKQGPAGVATIRHQNPAAVSIAASTLAAANAASIDTDLLVRILNDPDMIQKLVGDGTTTARANDEMANPPNQPMLSAPVTPPDSNSGLIFRPNQASIAAPTYIPRSDPIYPDLNRVQPVPPNVTNPNIMRVEPAAGQPVKDFDYFKNLIREHGADMSKMHFGAVPKQSSAAAAAAAIDYGENRKMREVNAKFQKACMYFKSSRGCRSGGNCRYRHDLSFQMHTWSGLDEAPCAKRMRFFNGQVSGRT